MIVYSKDLNYNYLEYSSLSLDNQDLQDIQDN
jgi:hypothetical protein